MIRTIDKGEIRSNLSSGMLCTGRSGERKPAGPCGNNTVIGKQKSHEGVDKALRHMVLGELIRATD